LNERPLVGMAGECTKELPEIVLARRTGSNHELSSSDVIAECLELSRCATHWRVCVLWPTHVHEHLASVVILRLLNHKFKDVVYAARHALPPVVRHTDKVEQLRTIPWSHTIHASHILQPCLT